jgi:tetratricopeptide (TPR) repeat protein
MLAVAHARLAGLAAEARHALRAASIFGEVFWAGAVGALVGARAREATEWLETLVDREVLVRRHGDRFPAEVEYGFRHGLLREAAYAMLTEDDRKTGHRLAGSWLERAGEKDAVVLAEHYEKGGAGELAVRHLARAAQSALEAGSVTAAMQLVERGVRCGAEGTVLGQLRLVQASVDYHRGAWEACLESARGAIPLLEKGRADWFVAASAVFYAATALGDPVAATSIGEEILSLSFEPEPSGPYAIAMSNLFGGLIAFGRLDTAMSLFDRLDRIDTGGRAADPVFSMLVAHMRTATAILRSQFGAALRACRSCLEVATATGHGIGLTTAHLDMALLMTELGRCEEAEAHAQEAIATATTAGATLMRGWAVLYVAFAMIRGGKPREALSQASLALGTLDDASARLTLAEAHLALGEHDAAEKYAREVLALAARVLTAPWLAPQSTLVLAEVELARGRLSEALALAERALEGRGRFASPALPPRMLSVHAEILRALGEIERARVSIREARELVERAASTIEEPELRESYLGEMFSARALALARELGHA